MKNIIGPLKQAKSLSFARYCVDTEYIQKVYIRWTEILLFFSFSSGICALSAPALSVSQM